MFKIIFFLILSFTILYADNLKNLERECYANDNYSCLKLGLFYATNEDNNNTKSLSLAKHFFELSCNDDNARGCFLLSAFPLYGIQEDFNISNAISLLKRSCDLSYGRACYTLGSLYYTGQGAIPNKYKSSSYYEKSCNLNFSPGCFFTGLFYYDLGKSYGDKKDFQTANYFFKKSKEPLELECYEGEGLSCYALGIFYERGLNGKKDILNAFSFYDYGCQYGSPESCLALGFLYNSDNGEIKKDTYKAHILFNKACNMGYALSCATLAESYEFGIGITKDLIKAEDLYLKACDSGFQSACNDFENLNEYLVVHQDPFDAPSNE